MGGEIAEFAFGIDEHDCREIEGLLDNLAQGSALARAAAALDEQPPGEQAFEVQHERATAVPADRHGPLVGGGVDLYDCCHGGISWGLACLATTQSLPLPFACWCYELAIGAALSPRPRRPQSGS